VCDIPLVDLSARILEELPSPSLKQKYKYIGSAKTENLLHAILKAYQPFMQIHIKGSKCQLILSSHNYWPQIM
jgi:hypothetical protein